MSWLALLALSAIALLAYTYVGYPLLQLLRARGAVRTRNERDWEPMVSVLMSVHDAADRIALKLENLSALDWPADRIEFLIYSDGSTDQTEEIVERHAAKDSRIRLVRGAERLGKPSALNRMKELASGSVLLLTDVRPLLDPKAVRALVRPLSDPEIGCVSGSLELDGDSGAGAYWRYEKLIRSSESMTGGMVGVTGAVYAIRREDFPKLPPDVILDDMWVPLTVALRTHRRIELRDEARAYDRAFDDEREFERKVRTLAGNYQLLQKMPVLLDPAVNPLWLSLVSHKLLRLLCPFALVLLLVICASAQFLPAKTRAEELALAALLFGQLAFYLLALLGARAGRLAKLSRSFVVLNAAALVGFWRFARGTQKVTW